MTQCLFNRGIVLVDTAAWKRQHVTEEIEQWMVWDHFAAQAFGYGAFRKRKSVSQAPFLAALMNRFTDLGREWNVRGLGRLSMMRSEVERLAQMGFRNIPRRYVTDTRTNWMKVPAKLGRSPTRLRLGGMHVGHPAARTPRRLPNLSSVSMC